MIDFQIIIEFIRTFGFPIAVACWALWRLDKNWGKGEVFQAQLDDMNETMDRVEVLINKNNEIQSELVTTVKVLQTIISHRNGGGGSNDN